MAKVGDIDFRIEGDKELIEALRKLGQAADAVAAEAVTAGAEIVKAEIERRAPRDSGDLVTGLEVKRGRWKTAGANAVVTIKSREQVYAFYLEFGAPTRSRGGPLPKQPFIRPAYDQTREAAEAAVVARLKKVLDL